MQQLDRLVNRRQPFGAIVHRLQFLEQRIERRAFVVGAILAAALRHRIRAIQHEQEIFRIRIVGVPAHEEHLRVALAHFFLQAVPVGAAHVKLDVDPGELLAVPVKSRLVARPAVAHIKGQHQRAATLRIAPGRESGFGQQALGFSQRAPQRFAVLDLVGDRIDRCQALLKPENAGRQRALRGDPAAIAENRDELLHVDGDGDRLADFARALGIFRVGATDHRIEPVEGQKRRRGRGGGAQANAARFHLGAQPGFALDAGAHRLVEIVRIDARAIVIALQEFVPVGDRFLLAGEHHTIDERHGLAGVIQQSGFAVTGLALGRIGFTAKIRVARHHHARIRIVLGQHVGAGAYRIPVEREVALFHAGLRIKLVGLPRHRREKRHRHPVQKLRVLALDADFIGHRVDHPDPCDLKPAQVQPGLAPAPGFEAFQRSFESVAVFLEPDDVVGHVAENRRIHPRVRQALDLIHIVVGGQEARGADAEIGQLKLARDHRARQLAIGRDKGRMRLITDIRPDADFIDRGRDQLRRRVRRQIATSGIQVARFGQSERGARRQLVWPFEVVVLERRFVNLCIEGGFVLGVGAGRVKMLGTFRKRGVERVVVRAGGGIRVVPGLAAAGEAMQHKAEGAKHDGLTRASANSADERFEHCSSVANRRPFGAQPYNHRFKSNMWSWQWVFSTANES